MNQLSSQHGAALVVSLVIIVILTLTGVLALNRSTMQQKMATLFDSSGMAFDAAEVAIDGVVFEQEDVTLDGLLRVLTIARGVNPFDPDTQIMSCYDTGWTDRRMIQSGLSRGAAHTSSGFLQSDPQVSSWSKTAYVGEGSRNISGESFSQGIHFFQVRGCGHVKGSRTTTGNMVQVFIYGPKESE